MSTPIQQAENLQQIIELVKVSHFYTLFPQEMSESEQQLLLAAPCAAAHCLASSAEWMEQPKSEIHLLLLNPGQLDAIDEGLSWGVIPYLLGLSGLIPVHLTIVGEEIDLADSSAESSELRSITVTKYESSPIEFLLEYPEYRADAAFLLHPSSEFSSAGVNTLRELQVRGIATFGASLNQTEGEQLEQILKQKGVAEVQWHQANPFALPLKQFTDSDAIWANTLWHINPSLENSSPDCLIADLTRQTVLNIIEGGEMVNTQYLSDLQQEQSALTAVMHLLSLLDMQSRTELSAHLFWTLFSLIRQGDAVEQRNELMRLNANLGWLAAAELPPEPPVDTEVTEPPTP